MLRWIGAGRVRGRGEEWEGIMQDDKREGEHGREGEKKEIKEERVTRKKEVGLEKDKG